MNESGDLSGSDELDEFEQSVDEAKAKNQKNATSYQNKPYDEAYEVSQDLSMAESFDGRDKESKGQQLKNDKYDEAVEVSQSMDPSYPSATAGAKPQPKAPAAPAKPGPEDYGDAKGMSKTNEMSKSQSVLNRQYDEALEFSASGSDKSVDTRGDGAHAHHQKSPVASSAAVLSSIPQSSQVTMAPMPQRAQPAPMEAQHAKAAPAARKDKDKDKDEESSSEEEGEGEGDISALVKKPKKKAEKAEKAPPKSKAKAPPKAKGKGK
mmetsp:Transcript_9080/g.20018  ORF Transcript_9080/g.20018 Transcript_9080/m.20018 type:complete len:265 (-) Transcript_9080:162-956(-)|eukprot:CAMPEP_0173370216 /NCGR_PEP_ID=MMETSP1144-20121109/26562_1 /TAXON_ID=483371 /ORGANISM="non described non described, Strain CCMP2298" /LENGTH=264 /DNA_ID=CAMNT_0014321741 /DNA_START=61 /DNA_END=855 /DNA_ORIENTATION=-